MLNEIRKLLKPNTIYRYTGLDGHTKELIFYIGNDKVIFLCSPEPERIGIMKELSWMGEDLEHYKPYNIITRSFEYIK